MKERVRKTDKKKTGRESVRETQDKGDGGRKRRRELGARTGDILSDKA